MSANAGDARDVGLIPGLGRSPGGGNGTPLQNSCLENSRDRGAWWATVHGVAKSWTQLSNWAHTCIVVYLSALNIVWFYSTSELMEKWQRLCFSSTSQLSLGTWLSLKVEYEQKHMCVSVEWSCRMLSLYLANLCFPSYCLNYRFHSSQVLTL